MDDTVEIWRRRTQSMSDRPVCCSPANHAQYCRYLQQLYIEFLERYKIEVPSYTCTNNFIKIKTLGKGAIGTVYLVRLVETDSHNDSDDEKDKYFAMKVLEKEKLVKLKQIKYARREKETLCAIRFPFLVHMVCWHIDKLNINFVLPFLPGGDFFNLINKNGKLKESCSKFYAAQILLGLEYLHACHLVYRDLKPENILVGGNGYLKITDFGCCKEIEKRTWSFCGTPEYIAPEMISGKGYGFGVDWWAFGVIVFEMISGFSPFYGKSVLNTYERILSCQYKCPGYFSQDLRDFLAHLLERDITRRYGNLKNGTNDMKAHRWLKDLKWESILHSQVTPPIMPEFLSPLGTSNFDAFEDVALKKVSVPLYEKEFMDF